MLRAALFDVGGTLLSEDTYLTIERGAAARLARLRERFGADLPWFADVVRADLERDEHEGVPLRQDTHAVLRAFLAERGVAPSDEEIELVREACCIPSVGLERPRPGALEALRFAHERGLRVALVTNVLWRTGAEALADWTARGAADCIDAIVTSLDVGWRKPHRAMFERALGWLRVDARDAVMVGNSRAADVAPAKAMGMRAVLVRSREPTVSDLAPDAVIDEMTELPAVLEPWLPRG